MSRHATLLRDKKKKMRRSIRNDGGGGKGGAIFPRGALADKSSAHGKLCQKPCIYKIVLFLKNIRHILFYLISFINQTFYTCAIHKWTNTILVLTNHNPPSKAAWLERGSISCIRPEFIVFFSLSNISFLRVVVLDIVGEVSAWTLEYVAMFLVLFKESVIRWSP